ncbi:hydroxylysine kinase-like [Lineus longissimus]|uniref:hydroxylysine kinase-like n=1 Tax=Lineus longissimus TaxID=88925 RepID=UPI002B4C6E08
MVEPLTNGTAYCESEDHFKPDECIRSSISETQARDLAKRLYGLTVTSIRQFNGYHDRNFYLTVDQDCSNPHIDEVLPHGYVLKIINTLDSKTPEHLDAQSSLLRHIHAKMPGCCPLPVKNVDGNFSSLETILQGGQNGTGTQHIVRLLCFIPGVVFHQMPQPDYDIYYDAGQFLGRLDIAIKDFSSPAFEARFNCWSMYWVPNLKRCTYAVRDPKRRALAAEVIEEFVAQVIPNYNKLQKGTIHGDFNEQNVLVTPKDGMDNADPTTETKYKHIGIIDFGENANACYVFEIGLSMMYLSTCSRKLDFIEAGGHLLAGYLTHMTLSDLEFDLLRTVVAARYAQSLVLGEYFYSLEKNEYCLSTSSAGWLQLEKLWETPKEKVMEIWSMIIEQRKDQHLTTEQ